MADIFKSKYTGEQIETLLEKTDGISVQSGADEQEFESITIEGKTYHLPQQEEPQEVEANPADEATDDLTKLKVGNTTYAIPESGSSVVANPSAQGTANLERLEVDGRVYYLPQQTEVQANPQSGGDIDLHSIRINGVNYRIVEPETVSANVLQTPSTDLQNIQVGQVVYRIPQPQNIEANPAGASVQTLDRILIDGIIYDTPQPTVVNANPTAQATEILSKVQIGGTIYTILSGGAPIEISTEAAMNAVLEGAQIGAIFKYVGATTDTYENGALYVVESNVTLISFTIISTTYQAEEDMTWEQWVESEYNTGGVYIAGSNVYTSSGSPIGIELTPALPTDSIIPNTVYDAVGGGAG